MLDKHQKHYLRSLAHARKAIVIVGGNGLTPAVLNEIDLALSHHELVKVRINAEDRPMRDAMIEQINTALSAELIQRVGHVATFFRRNPESPRIQLTGGVES